MEGGSYAPFKLLFETGTYDTTAHVRDPASRDWFLAFALPTVASAIDLLYSVQTSTPEGRAVCSFSGHVLDTILADTLQLTITPAAGQEARLTGFIRGVPPQKTAAGVEESCDIFDPDDPSNTISIQLPATSRTNFGAVLDIHAHPNNCGASDVGSGTVSAVVLSATPRELRFFTGKCDGNQDNANLRTDVDSPAQATRGQSFEKYVQITNHGPGDATRVNGSVTIPKTAFLESFALWTPGTCIFNGTKLDCDFGDLPVGFTTGIDIHLVPLKTGNLTTKYTVGADNIGALFGQKETVKTPIVAGTGALLDLSIKCKGTVAQVEINPDALGGTTTCTCPDFFNPNLDNFRCAVQNYTVQTQVTLTPLGLFSKFDKACKGQNPCVLDMDPAAAKPDKKTKATFKP